MKHPHAELMAQYAQDAMETDKPWERWETLVDGWVWCDLEGSPTWVQTKYRRKKKPYKPTLLDQALELEIEALKMRIKHYHDSPSSVHAYSTLADYLQSRRSPEMIEHLKQQGKL